MTDHDHTRPVPAPQRVRNWEDNRAYRPGAPSHRAPAPHPASVPHPAPAVRPRPGGREQGVYRERALREHSGPRVRARVEVTIGGPPFPLLWAVVAVVFAAGAALIVFGVGR